MDIKRKGEDSLFIRTSPGRYTMREYVTSGLIPMGATGDGKAKQVDYRPVQPPAPTPVLGSALSAERAPTRAATSSEERPARRAGTEDTASV
jgi:hypothetical protein